MRTIRGGHPTTIIFVISHRDFSRCVLIGAEAELRRYPANLVELLVVADVDNLQSIADGVSDDGVAEVGEFGVGLAAHQAIRSQVVVRVAAVIALHSGRAKARRQHQGLYLS